MGGNGGLSGIGIGGQTSGSASAGTSSNDQFSPPSALELKNLKDQTEMLFGDDGSEINDIVEKMKVLRTELRYANPLRVQPRVGDPPINSGGVPSIGGIGGIGLPASTGTLNTYNAAAGPRVEKRTALYKYLDCEQGGRMYGQLDGVVAEWDDDTPTYITRGDRKVPRSFTFNQVDELATELSHDHSRSLELLVAISRDSAFRRNLEQISGLPSGELDANKEEPRRAAAEMFYVERESIGGILENLFVGAMNIRDDHRRQELRDLIYRHLLDTDLSAVPPDSKAVRDVPPLTVTIPGVLCSLTSEISKLSKEFNADAGVLRRRRHLRTQRLKLAEVLVLLYQSFRPTKEGLGKLVEITRILSQSEGLTEYPQPGASQPDRDDMDDRSGILRTIVLLQLSMIHALDDTDGKYDPTGTGNSSATLNEFTLRLKTSPEFDLLPIDWKGTMKDGEFQNFLARRHRRDAPDAYRIQGFNALIFAAFAPIDYDHASKLKLKKLFEESWNHFALSWFTDVILPICRLDACNCSDFRSRPPQMLLFDHYTYHALGSLLANLNERVFKERWFDPPEKYCDFFNKQAGSRVIKEQDCLEHFVAMYADFVVLCGEQLRYLSIGGIWRHAEHIGWQLRDVFFEILEIYKITFEDHLNDIINPPIQPGSKRDEFYKVNGRLMEAMLMSESIIDDLLTEPMFLDDENVLNEETAYYQYWFRSQRLFKDTETGRTVKLSLFDVGGELATLANQSSFETNRKFLNAQLISAWVSCLGIVRRVIEAREEGERGLIDQMFIRRADYSREHGDMLSNRVPLVGRIFWICQTDKEFAAEDAAAQELLPQLYRECFKILGSYASRSASGNNISTVEDIWQLMIEKHDLARRDDRPPLFAKALSDDPYGIAMDGLLCLLGEVLPIVAANDGALGFDQGNSDETGSLKMRDWILWVGRVIEGPCKPRVPGEDDPCPFRWKLLARALQVFFLILAKSDSQSDSPQSAAGIIMNEMLSRGVLLPHILSILYSENEAAFPDASRVLDEFAASESRNAVRQLLSAARPTSSSYLSELPVEPWAWWRQRSGMLALAVLNAVAKREDKYIESWYATTRKQVCIIRSIL